jgi:hypothetical protein
MVSIVYLLYPNHFLLCIDYLLMLRHKSLIRDVIFVISIEAQRYPGQLPDQLRRAL